MATLNYNEIRLIKYSKLIDQAILRKRYVLATHLAYRCLVEYYRLFLRFRVPHGKLTNKNAFQLSLEVVQYLRKSPGKWKLHPKYLYRILTTSYQLTRLSAYRAGDRNLHCDLAMATYAKQNALAISEMISGSLQDKAGKDPQNPTS